MKIFKLFANCITVKGFRRSIVCDLQRGDYELIPNALFSILNDKEVQDLDSVIQKYGKEHEETIVEYFNFLVEKELGFWTNTPELFPEMSMHWESSSLITNAVIDYDKDTNHDYMSMFRDLEELGCKHIQLRFFDRVEPELLIETLSHLDESIVTSLEIYLKFDEAVSNEDYSILLRRFPRIEKLIVHSSPDDTFFNDFEEHRELTTMLFVKQKIDSVQHCGVVQPYHFAINIFAFTESLAFNSCLNGKISIDQFGHIKNCPSMKQSYGKYSETSLKQVACEKKFQQIWSISKDKISGCKDCEFRYICTDCRAYTDDQDDPLSRPSKCNYNPYIGKWEGEEGYIPYEALPRMN